jgi:hypothetical protein
MAADDTPGRGSKQAWIAGDLRVVALAWDRDGVPAFSGLRSGLRQIGAPLFAAIITG